MIEMDVSTCQRAIRRNCLQYETLKVWDLCVLYTHTHRHTWLGLVGEQEL